VQGAHEAQHQVQQEAEDLVHGRGSTTAPGGATSNAGGSTATGSSSCAPGPGNALPTTSSNRSTGGTATPSATAMGSGTAPSSHASKIFRAIGAAVEPP